MFLLAYGARPPVLRGMSMTWWPTFTVLLLRTSPAAAHCRALVRDILRERDREHCTSA
jgi:hypothetical protein